MEDSETMSTGVSVKKTVTWVIDLATFSLHLFKCSSSYLSSKKVPGRHSHGCNKSENIQAYLILLRVAYTARFRNGRFPATLPGAALRGAISPAALVHFTSLSRCKFSRYFRPSTSKTITPCWRSKWWLALFSNNLFFN